MFDKETLDAAGELSEKWQQEISGRKQYKQLELDLETDSGIRLKPVYSPADIENINYSEIGMPGSYPYTRGIYPLDYQVRPWMNQPIVGYGLPEQCRERMDFLADQGMRGYFGQLTFNLVWDSPTKLGFDPDQPESRGKVGQCGVSACTVADMDILFHDLHLDKSRVVLNVFEPALVNLAMYLVHAERRGYAPNQLIGNTVNGPWLRCILGGIGFPPAKALKLTVELIKYCSKNMPQWNTTNLVGYDVREAGGSAVEEVGLILSVHIGLAEACIKAGLDPDEFIPRFSFQIASGMDFFEEIAKHRALRRMWAKINKERFGCRDPKSLQARFHTHTQGSALTAQQPLNNIIRVTIEALAAVLGGTQSIATVSYDEAIAIPTQEAHTIALRTQHIIYDETNVNKVSDPLGGSYYIEHLTNEIEKRANELIGEVDKAGGYLKAWESGWFRQRLDRSAYRWREAVNQGKKPWIGVNKYVGEEKISVPVFEHDPEIEKIAIDRVQKFRQRRDNTTTKAALNHLRRVVSHEDNDLMPSILDAVRADATLGEIMDVFRDVYQFGWYV